MTRARATIWVALAFVASVLAWSSCGSSGSYDLEPGPRRSMLIALSDVVILPSYRELVRQAQNFSAVASALEQNPDEATLAAAQDAWRSARRAWKRTEAFRIGPTESLRLRIRTKLDWSPTNPDRIEDEIAGSTPISPEYVDTLGVTRRGFLACEYLLFDPAGNPLVVLAQLQGDGGERRRAYLAALAADIATQAQILLGAWESPESDFRGELVNAGQGSATYDSIKKAVDELANAMAALALAIETKKLGEPAGLVPGKPSGAELIDTWRSGNGLADLLDNVESLETTYTCRLGGAGGTSLSDLVAAVAPLADDSIRAALFRARSAAAAIPQPLHLALTQHPQEVEIAYVQATALRVAMSIDLISALGATPQFIGDGD